MFTPRRIRKAAELIVMTTIVAATVRCFLVQGIILPVRVASGSMATNLLGPHWQLECPQCHLYFPCGVEFAPRNDEATCPQCGFTRVPVESQPLQLGDRVLIDKMAYSWRSPRRHEVLVSAEPQPPYKLVMKRVLGLPGERIGIRQGDVYADGRRVQKDLRQFRQVAQFVFRGNNRPPAESRYPPRLRPQSNPSRWERDGIHFEHRQSLFLEPDTPIDWLTYHHWNTVAGQLPRGQAGTIRDDYPYDQHASYELHEVGDLLLRLEMMLGDEQTQAWVRMNTGYHELEVRIEYPNKLFASIDNGPEQPFHAKRHFDFRRFKLDLAFCDGRMLVGVDDEEPLIVEPADRSPSYEKTFTPVSIGAKGDLTLHRFRLFRDIYYTAGRNGRDGVWQMDRPLADDEYFLLGDNSPISEDSRFWPSIGVRRRSIVGRAVPAPSWLGR